MLIPKSMPMLVREQCVRQVRNPVSYRAMPRHVPSRRPTKPSSVVLHPLVPSGRRSAPPKPAPPLRLSGALRGVPLHVARHLDLLKRRPAVPSLRHRHRFKRRARRSGRHVVAHRFEDQAVVSTRGQVYIDVDVNPEFRFDFIRGCRLIVANCRLS